MRLFPGYAVYEPWQIVYKTDNFACFTVLSKKILVMESLILTQQWLRSPSKRRK